jgi:hypothetical protein
MDKMIGFGGKRLLWKNSLAWSDPFGAAAFSITTGSMLN